MSLTRWLGVAVIVAGVSAPAMADILVWRDRAGISHYTNDIANVPPEYRADAMTVAKDWARTQPAPEPAPVPAAAVAADPATATAHGGYDEAYRAGFRAGEQSSEPGSNTGSVAQNAVAPPQRAPFIQGPAGPPPVTER